MPIEYPSASRLFKPTAYPHPFHLQVLDTFYVLLTQQRAVGDHLRDSSGSDMVDPQCGNGPLTLLQSYFQGPLWLGSYLDSCRSEALKVAALPSEAGLDLCRVLGSPPARRLLPLLPPAVH